MTLIAQNREFDDVITHFQVFGERRCGTNYVHALIEQNVLVKAVRNYGWKHGYPSMPCIRRDALIVAVVREPFSWLSSLHNRPFSRSHHELEFSDFLRTEWHDFYRPPEFGHAKWGYKGMPKHWKVPTQVDRHPITGKRFANPLEMRNVKNAGFCGFLHRECNVAVVDYDQTNKNPETVLASLAKTFDLDSKGEFVRPSYSGPKGRDKPRVRKEDISADDLAFIRETLDWDLEKKLGYGDS